MKNITQLRPTTSYLRVGGIICAVVSLFGISLMLKPWYQYGLVTQNALATRQIEWNSGLPSNTPFEISRVFAVLLLVVYMTMVLVAILSVIDFKVDRTPGRLLVRRFQVLLGVFALVLVLLIVVIGDSPPFDSSLHHDLRGGTFGFKWDLTGAGTLSIVVAIMLVVLSLACFGKSEREAA